MWVSGEEVEVGESVRVSAVGGLNSDGLFWVRLVHSEQQKVWQQEMTLAFISASL